MDMRMCLPDLVSVVLVEKVEVHADVDGGAYR